MNDFAPEIRNAAWWATDSRRAIKGGLIDVLREKKGLAEIEVVDSEAAAMGKRMQPTILKLAEEQIGARVREMDSFAICRSEPWLRAHTDGMIGECNALVEAKNYHFTKMNKFSAPDEIMRIPPEDEVQCLHEAAVFNVSRVYLAVIFGGQAFRMFTLDFSAERREEFIKTAATWWAYTKTGDMPDPLTPAQAATLYSADNGETVQANREIEGYCQALRQLKAQIDVLEGQEKSITTVIEAYMRESAVLVDAGGYTLATWKKAKDSTGFDRDLFKSQMPDLYQKFMISKLGSRRFLLKEGNK